MTNRPLKWLMVILGSLMLLLGLITFWLPLPIGLPLAAAGVFLLVSYSPAAKRLLIQGMRRYPGLRRLLNRRRRYGSNAGKSASRPDSEFRT